MKGVGVGFSLKCALNTYTIYNVITARVRSTREVNVLTPVCVSVHTCEGGGGRGGLPHLRSGGYPIPGLDRGGVPHPRSGYPPPDMGWDTPQTQVWLGGIPSQVWSGVPHPRSGYPPPPGHGMGYPPWTWHGVTPPPETDQHSEHLLCGGRYASCVHAGGLSCYKLLFVPLVLK